MEADSNGHSVFAAAVASALDICFFARAASAGAGVTSGIATNAAARASRRPRQASTGREGTDQARRLQVRRGSISQTTHRLKFRGITLISGGRKGELELRNRLFPPASLHHVFYKHHL